MGGLGLTHDDEFLTRPVAAADGELVINSSPDTVRCKKFNVAADTADEIHFVCCVSSAVHHRASNPMVQKRKMH